MHQEHDRLLIGTSALVLGVALLVILQSLSWLDRPFPGFLVLSNRIVPSAGLGHWPATAGGILYQHEVVAVNSLPLEQVETLHATVARHPPGTPITYTFRRGALDITRTIKTQRFGRFDFILLFGALFLNGVALSGTALMIRFLRGADRTSMGAFSTLLIAGLWALTAVDLYGPYRLFRLHALCETLLFASVLHMALVFPMPLRLVDRHPRVVWGLYGLAIPLVTANQLGLQDPDLYRTTHQIATSLIGLSLAVLIGTQLRWYLKPPNFEIRQRVKVVALGGAASLSIPVALAIGAAVTGGATPQNAMSFTAIFYPLSIGYAILRHNLLEVDVFVRRTLNYALLTAIATIAYAGMVQAFDFLFSAAPSANGNDLGFAITLVLVILLLPLRDRVQSIIDRIFFRTAYDFRRVVETASARLASQSDLLVIVDEVSKAVTEPLHPEFLTLHVRRGRDAPFTATPPDPTISSLAPAQIERLGHAPAPIDEANGGLSVPFRADGELIAVLSLGRLQSGGMYGADDRRLLQTLANQGAVAIENALVLEQLRDLNRDLEEKVEERTRELREAHAQLVHREKMASLGQFVAGIAHEINNPLNFIQGNLHCLREYVDVLKGSVPRDQLGTKETEQLEEVLEDIESAFEGCAEGVERSTTLVTDLRAFSRLDSPERTETDLHGSIRSTLNLLRGRLHGIDVVERFESIPLVRCIAGQIDQVFVNLISNAADALGSAGRIEIRTSTPAIGVAAIEIADDGPGIDPDCLDRVFDPFFTTKEVGKGTGLGLSISYGIVRRHGGTITVHSTPGEGTCFRIELPVESSDD